MLLVFGDDPQVLNGRDQVILNALSPQSAPASSLKAVLNGCLGEVALLKPLPALAVRARLRGMGCLGNSPSRSDPFCSPHSVFVDADSAPDVSLRA